MGGDITNDETIELLFRKSANSQVDSGWGLIHLYATGSAT